MKRLSLWIIWKFENNYFQYERQGNWLKKWYKILRLK